MFGETLRGLINLDNLCLMITNEKDMFDESLFQNKFFIKHFFPVDCRYFYV